MSGSGSEPMPPDRTPVDIARAMDALLRYPEQARRRTASAAGGITAAGDVADRPAPDHAMEPAAHTDIRDLRERVRRAEYVVDAQAVAAALVARLWDEAPARRDPQG